MTGSADDLGDHPMRLRSTLRMITIAAVVLTACGGGSSSTEPPGDGNTVQVQAFDRQDYNADGFSAVAGEITFRLSQIGVQEHTLTVEGLEGQMRLVVKNGGTDSGKLTLEPGRYVLYCDIAGHRVSGMEARLTVG